MIDVDVRKAAVAIGLVRAETRVAITLGDSKGRLAKWHELVGSVQRCRFDIERIM